jgi:hypothetical protein
MMPNLAYHSALLEGKIVRNLYRALVPISVRCRVHVPRELSFNVFAYSGESMLPEQAASIRSFLTHVGRPKEFIVVSDGSYSAASAALLEKIDICVRVRQEPPALAPGLSDNVRSYLLNHATGKQLALLMSLPENGPSLYTDSDVLFFPGARVIVDLARAKSVSAFYLADFQFSGDKRLIMDPTEERNPANTGFVFLFQKLDWSLGLERLEKLNSAPNFFTNQTVTHLCLHASGARPLDSEKFVLRLDDQVVYRDRYASSSIAIRHYVNPIRHKFWTTLVHRSLQ